MSKGEKRELIVEEADSLGDEELLKRLEKIKLEDITVELKHTEWGYSLHEFLQKLNVKLDTHKNENMSEK